MKLGEYIYSWIKTHNVLAQSRHKVALYISKYKNMFKNSLKSLFCCRDFKLAAMTKALIVNKGICLLSGRRLELAPIFYDIHSSITFMNYSNNNTSTDMLNREKGRLVLHGGV